MIIFIDEGGHFVPSAGISVLCSLALPHGRSRSARAALTVASRAWPKTNGELKGGNIAPEQLAELVEILYRHDALLHCIATDLSVESQDDITSHRLKQCDGLTKYLVPQHHPDFQAQVRALSATLERMPNQLYVQFVLLSDLVMATAENAALYFAQRNPIELGEFEWVIDGKDPKRVTVQEAWWRDTLGPLGESKSRHRPFAAFRDPGFDYSHFDKSFAFEKALWTPEGPGEVVAGVDISKLITKSVKFPDSRSDILIQAVDILANHMRRTLNGPAADLRVVRSLGRLQIIRRRDKVLQSVEFASFGKDTQYRKGLGRLCRLMTNAGRPMISKAFTA